MADPYPIRPFGPDEYAAFHAVDEHAFHGGPLTEQKAEARVRQMDFGRTLAATDDGTPVGLTSAWTLRSCVPGAMAPVAGVTWVAVLPTHRRRGILSSLMRRQLADLSEGGEAVAMLWASEAGIYGRYGYGPASWHASFTVGRGEGALTRQAAGLAAGLRLRLADPESARAELSGVYEAVLPTRPGMFARDEHWWNRVLGTAEAGTAEASTAEAGSDPMRCVLAEDGSGPRGYALYTARGRWDENTFLADSSLDVQELMAADPQAAAALWGDLLGRDLVTEFTARLRPPDDPLFHLLADPRRMRQRTGDGLWVRLVDVPRALAQRRYASPVDVTLNVTDEICPQNQRTWHLTAGTGAGAGARGHTLAPAGDALGPATAGATPSPTNTAATPGPANTAAMRTPANTVVTSGPANTAVMRTPANTVVTSGRANTAVTPSRANGPGPATGAGAPGLAGSCEPTAAPADISMDVSALGAAYLGGTRLGSLAAAGLIIEHRPGALAALSAAMSWDPAPWCPMIF